MPRRSGPLLRCCGAAGFAAAAFLGSACTPALRAHLVSAVSADAAPSATERQVIDSVNQFRAAHGLRALFAHPNLERKARLWATWMANGNCGRSATGQPALCHSNLPSGITVGWSVLEENVGNASPADVSAVTSGFEHSPEHAANMLNARITSVGVGVAYSGSVIFVTEEFMAP